MGIREVAKFINNYYREPFERISIRSLRLQGYHIVETDIDYFGGNDLDIWIEENCQDIVVGDILSFLEPTWTFFFKNEIDAVAFKLTWIGK